MGVEDRIVLFFVLKQLNTKQKGNQMKELARTLILTLIGSAIFIALILFLSPANDKNKVKSLVGVVDKG